MCRRREAEVEAVAGGEARAARKRVDHVHFGAHFDVVADRIGKRDLAQRLAG